ncbi:MAG: homoserine dehydrogenase [Pseudomonadota bacterium]
MTNSSSSAPLNIGIAGLGTVGSSLIQLLTSKAETLSERCGRPLQVVAVNARHKSKDRGVDLSPYRWIDDPVALANDDAIDVFVELIGGEDGPAYDSVKAALQTGKHVVTANKALLAKHGVELAALAEGAGRLLNFEAAVAGGIPVIKAMRESLTANDVERVYGILNGTCNYILTRMEDEGLTFEACLADAQTLGYAEADPTFDIEGFDTAHKLAILTSLAFGTKIAGDEIYVEGITKVTIEDIQAASELGYTIKLLGVAQRSDTGVEARVHPAMVPTSSPIGQISGVTNAVAIEADVVGSLMMSGPGAGGDATASAVAGDIADIAKSRPGNQHGPALGQPAAALADYQRARMRAHEGGYFIRLSVLDRPGAMAAIATAMAKESISLESIVQRRTSPRDPNADHSNEVQPLILITHETTEEAIRRALDAIRDNGELAAEPQMIRIEKLGA